MRNMRKARELARARGFDLDLSRAMLHGRKADGSNSCGFSIHLATGESETRACSFGGALLARDVCNQIARLLTLPTRDLQISPGAIHVP